MNTFEQFDLGAYRREEHTRTPEQVNRRGRRFSDYINRIEGLQTNYYLKQERKKRPKKGERAERLILDDRHLQKGINAALMALSGAGAATWSLVKRGEYGSLGHVLAAAGTFFGAQLFGHKVFESIQYFVNVPREKLDTWREKKDILLTDDDHEEGGEMSEFSLRGRMLALQLEVREIVEQVKGGVQEYREEKDRISEKARIALEPEADRELLYERSRFLRKRLHYVDEMIAKQEELLHTMKDYHDLSRFHEEKRSWAPLGFASAATLLEGVHASADFDMSALRATGEKISNIFSTLFQSGPKQSLDGATSASLGPALIAMATGWYYRLRESAGESERVNDISDILERIEGEIQGLRNYRGGLAGRLSQLRQQLGLEANEEITKAVEGRDAEYEKWSQRFEQLIAAQFNERQSSRVSVPHASQAEMHLAPTLEELFGLVTQEESSDQRSAPVSSDKTTAAPIQSAPSEVRIRAIEPLSRERILYSRRQTVVRGVVADIMRIAGRDVDAVTLERIEHMPLDEVLRGVLPGTLQSVASDVNVSEEQLDEVVRYFEELDENMTASIADHVFPTDEDIQSAGEVRKIMLTLDKGKRVQQALEKRQTEKVQEVLRRSPSEFRRFLLTRYHIIEAPGEGDITLSLFESSIRAWMKKTHRHDKSSFRNLLEICDRELAVMNVQGKQEKWNTINASIRILDSVDSEAPFVDPVRFSAGENETLVDKRRRALTPLVTAFKEMRDHSSFNREIKLHDILLGEWSRKDAWTKKEGDVQKRYISGASFHEASFAQYPNPLIDGGLRKVDSQYIVGSLAHEREVWIPEQQKGDVTSLVARMIDNPDAQTFDNIFFDPQGNERIELIKFVGQKPSTPKEKEHPIYFIRKGVEYVAAAKVLDIPVVARVIELRTPSFIEPIYPGTLSGERHATWSLLKNGKLIEGAIPEAFNINNGQQEVVTIKKSVLSWLPWFSLAAIAKICQQYDALYPGILDNLTTLDRKPIVKNALFTPQTLRNMISKTS